MRLVDRHLHLLRHDAALPKLDDLLAAYPMFRQDLVGVLAERRRRQ